MTGRGAGRNDGWGGLNRVSPAKAGVHLGQKTRGAIQPRLCFCGLRKVFRLLGVLGRS